MAQLSVIVRSALFVLEDVAHVPDRAVARVGFALLGNLGFTQLLVELILRFRLAVRSDLEMPYRS